MILSSVVAPKRRMTLIPRREGIATMESKSVHVLAARGTINDREVRWWVVVVGTIEDPRVSNKLANALAVLVSDGIIEAL